MSERSIADRFGAVLLNARGEVLLRKPKGNFGGYAWTFVKGRPVEGERPTEAALRHVLAETGWQSEILAEIPGTFTGTTSTANFFLAGRLGEQGHHDARTTALRWASFKDAADLIRESPNQTGRERDLDILRAAEQAKDCLTWQDRPATCEDDWDNLRSLPERRAEIPVDLHYTEAEMGKIRKGFRATDMDQKWVIWFRDGVLHLHRSWTGFCIFEVDFEQVGDGWRAGSALVNRTDEYKLVYEDDADEEDRHLLQEVIEYHLLQDDYEHPVPFGGALALATQPNYLGSPKVVSGLIQTVIDVAIEHAKGKNNFNGVWAKILAMSQEIADGDQYGKMPGWHTPAAIGQTLLKAFEIMPEPIFADNLDYPLSEAFMTIYLKVRELLVGFYADEAAAWDPDAVLQINRLHQWAVTVFLGTNDVGFPGVTISDFTWQEVEPAA